MLAYDYAVFITIARRFKVQQPGFNFMKILDQIYSLFFIVFFDADTDKYRYLWTRAFDSFVSGV